MLPDADESLYDIINLPFTTRADIEKGYPYDMFAVPLREVVRIHTSSGQARKPIVTGYTAGDLKAWAQAHGEVPGGTGMTRDDVIQISFRYGLMTGGFGFHAAAELIGASVIPADIGNIAEQVMIMRDYLTSLSPARRVMRLSFWIGSNQLNINPKSLRLRRAILGADRLSPAVGQGSSRVSALKFSTATAQASSWVRELQVSATPTTACMCMRTSSLPRSSIQIPVTSWPR